MWLCVCPNVSALTLLPALHSASWATSNGEKKNLINQSNLQVTIVKLTYHFHLVTFFLSTFIFW